MFDNLKSRVTKLEAMGGRPPEVILLVSLRKTDAEAAAEAAQAEDRAARARAQGRDVIRISIGPALRGPM